MANSTISKSNCIIYVLYVKIFYDGSLIEADERLLATTNLTIMYSSLVYVTIELHLSLRVVDTVRHDTLFFVQLLRNLKCPEISAVQGYPNFPYSRDNSKEKSMQTTLLRIYE